MSNLLITNVSEVKTASDERNYAVVTFSKSTPNGEVIPFSKSAKRLIWTKPDADGNQEWEGGSSPEVIKEWMNAKNTLEGDIKTFDVKPYTITDKNSGEEREVSTFTCVVLGHETPSSALSVWGRELRQESDSKTIQSPSTAKAAVAVAQKVEEKVAVEDF